MASFYADPAVGGDGSTTTDDADATTGLDNYGYTERLVPMFTNVVNIATYSAGRATAAAASAVAASDSAASALNAPGTNATSTTSLAIATGSKAFTIQTGKAYVVGQTLVAASAADPANFMAGQVTAHNSGTGALTILVTQTGGSGTKTDWVISMAAIVSSTLPSQTSNNGKVLGTNGTSASWVATLAPANNLSELTASAATVRTNLGLVIGTNVQAYDAGLLSIAGLTTAADKMIYTTALDTYAVTTLSSFARTLLDDADAAAMKTTLGVVIGTNVQAYHANLAALAGLTLAADKLAYGSGAGTLSLTDLSAFARTILDDANAGAVRSTVGAAALGANTDITSLGGLTTPLSVPQGGTGAATPAGIRTAAEISAGAAAIPTSYTLAGVGRATVSGGVVTDQFSNGYSIVRNSSGDFTITLDVAAASAASWVAMITCGHGSLNVSAEDVTQTSSTLNFQTRNGGNSLNDPTVLKIMIFIDS